MSTIHPDRKKRVRTALRWFSIAAWVTGVWLLILTTRMIAQYLLGMSIPSWAHYIGQVHGLFYILYLLATLNLGTKVVVAPAAVGGDGIGWLYSILVVFLWSGGGGRK